MDSLANGLDVIDLRVEIRARGTEAGVSQRVQPLTHARDVGCNGGAHLWQFDHRRVRGGSTRRLGRRGERVLSDRQGSLQRLGRVARGVHALKRANGPLENRIDLPAQGRRDGVDGLAKLRFPFVQLETGLHQIDQVRLSVGRVHQVPGQRNQR